MHAKKFPLCNIQTTNCRTSGTFRFAVEKVSSVRKLYHLCSFFNWQGKAVARQIVFTIFILLEFVASAIAERQSYLVLAWPVYNTGIYISTADSSTSDAIGIGSTDRRKNTKHKRSRSDGATSGNTMLVNNQRLMIKGVK